jgi:hypothetical protein
MKKLLFVLAFNLITSNMYSQIYMAILLLETTSTPISSNNLSGCTEELILIKIDPTGNITYDCLGPSIGTTINSTLLENHTVLTNLNQGLNSIINQGYKLTHISEPGIVGGVTGGSTGGGLIGYNGYYLNPGMVWYFAVP